MPYITSLLDSSVVNEPGRLRPRDGFDATDWLSLQQRKPIAGVNHEGGQEQATRTRQRGRTRHRGASHRGGKWSWPGSNRRPPPCKGGALPVELQPRGEMVGLSGFEPLTSRLSAVRSSQLSYRPVVPPRPAPLVDICFFKSERPPLEAHRGGSLKTRQAQMDLRRVQPVDSLERR
jgi:hypothetical protein